MPAGLLIRLRPTGPWRIGPDSGDRDRVERIFHSDALFSAVTSAIARLGGLEEWLDATARTEEPAVRFSSCFPFQGDTRFIVAPRNVWPPPASPKVRWKGARFTPLDVVKSLLSGRAIGEDKWTIDGPSECLVPMSSNPVTGPFRVAVHTSAAMDREGVAVAPHSTACLEFTPGSGLWFLAAFSDDAARERWTGPLTGAIRLLADSGMGGERSRGWGRFEMPEIRSGDLSQLLFDSPGSGAYWLLSLFHPAESDGVDWNQGNYAIATRVGRVESEAGWGEIKQSTRMIAEGSVLVSSSDLRGSVKDVAPEGFAHPVYRSGHAIAIPVPLKVEPVRAAS
jgi:CRISPR type III-A-associated RAMP protein Csm4